MKLLLNCVGDFCSETVKLFYWQCFLSVFVLNPIGTY